MVLVGYRKILYHMCINSTIPESQFHEEKCRADVQVTVSPERRYCRLYSKVGQLMDTKYRYKRHYLKRNPLCSRA